MSLDNHKITTYADNVKDLPDYPSDEGYTAKRLKEIFDARSDKEIKEKHNALIDELSEILTKQQERIENITGASVISAHDDLASILPADKEMYIIKYDSMPVQDKDGNVTVSDEVVYVTKIGDGVTSLAELPQTSTLISGIGTGSLTQFTDEEAYGIEKGDGTRLYPLPVAEGYASVALGRYTKATGNTATALNYDTLADGAHSFACNFNTHAKGEASFSSGSQTEAVGTVSHAEGYKSVSTGDYSHAEGYSCKAVGERSHAEGSSTKSEGFASHAEGNNAVADGQYAHAEGHTTVASGEGSHAEGVVSKATGKTSHAEGSQTLASGSYSHSEGSSTKAAGDYSHAEGASTEASGKYSHAEGASSKALNNSAHAEGFGTTASGQFSHSEGRETVALGIYSHSGGYKSSASKGGSFVHGNSLNTDRDYQVMFGQFNAPAPDALFVIGNGTDADNRSNAFTLNADNSLQLGNTKITEEEFKKLKTGTGGTTPVVSVHDDLAAVIPKEGEQYVIKYHDMPYGENPELISDAVFYRIKIGDGIHTLADLPVMSNIEAGTGNGSIRLVDPTYDNGEDGIEAPNTVASGQYSVSLGKYTVASGKASAAFNYSSEATGDRSFACNNGMSEGKVSFSANGAHAIGSHSAAFGTSTANGDQSFASGGTNQANGKYSHAGGYSSKALGNGSFAHGKNSVAEGEYSFAIGTNNTAGASNSFVSGAYNSANNGSQAVVGFYNVPVQEDMFMVGAGKAYISKDAEGNTVRDERRANAFEVNRRGIIKVNRTPYGEEAGTEPSLQLGNTVLSETVLSDMLTHGERIRELEETISALAARLDAYIAGGGEVPEGVATSFVTLDMFNAHVEDTENPHKVTAEQVNVDLTGLATTEYVDSSIQSAVLDSWEEKV